MASNDLSVEDSGELGGEYEREPVPEKALLGFGSFVGMYNRVTVVYCYRSHHHGRGNSPADH